jgi:hypothetical protein
MTSLKKIYLIVIPCLLVTAYAFAADDLPGYNLTIGRVRDIITGLACWVLQIILAIMIIALIWAGVRFFLAHGNPEKAKAAVENFKWVIIGIVVILATNVIIATVDNALGGDASYLPIMCEGDTE